MGEFIVGSCVSATCLIVGWYIGKRDRLPAPVLGDSKTDSKPASSGIKPMSPNQLRQDRNKDQLDRIRELTQ